MKLKLFATTAVALGVMLLSAPVAPAQAPAQPPPAASEAPQQYSQAQLDQMLAPIALYPDELLGQVVMAASYPLEVVEAERWLQDPDNAALRGDSLSAALNQQSWDPSVKSLIEFPQVLAMMNGNLDWTENLGEAFIADPGAASDAIQRLRRQAMNAGKLRSNAQQVVTDQDGGISIEPANAQTVDVPDYEPAVVYGAWAWPDDPPDFFPGYFDDCAFDDFGYCWYPIPIFLPLWGWDHWDWRGRRIDIDRDRFARLDHGRAPSGGAWAYDPSHRHGVPYQQPATRARFGGEVPGAAPGAGRAVRGYSPEPASAPPAPTVGRTPPSFESYGSGAQVRSEAARGQSSRGSAPSSSPHGFGGGGGFGRGFGGGGFSHGGPSVGGGGRR